MPAFADQPSYNRYDQRLDGLFRAANSPNKDIAELRVYLTSEGCSNRYSAHYCQYGNQHRKVKLVKNGKL
jgi:hypothetical protein